MGSWSPFSECSVSCGEGLQVRTREVAVEPVSGGNPCSSTEEKQRCNNGGCPGR